MSFDIDTSYLQSHIQSATWEFVGFWTSPSVLYKPSLSEDDEWFCASYGACIGYGETPAEAMADFDKNWRTQKIGKIRPTKAAAIGSLIK